MTDLSALGQAVTVDKVASLMSTRSPKLLDPDGDGQAGGTGAPSALFIESVWGVCTEVRPLIGDGPGVAADPDNPGFVTGYVPDPDNPGFFIVGEPIVSQRWDLAVWAVTLGVAAQLEASLYPEQQGIGDGGRAAILERRYQAALAQLRGRLPGDAVDEAAEGRPPAPRGNFPNPRPYPDPAFGRQGRSINWAPGGLC